MTSRISGLLRLSVLALMVSGSLMKAEVRLPKILASHMVVQRDLPVHVWGWAEPGETVSVSFRGDSRATKADELGQWSIYLSPGAAGGPFELMVKGTNTVTLSDVLVGDVWVASGQSNMEFEMRKAATAATDLPKAENSQIRLMIVSRNAAEYPQTDVNEDPAGNGRTWAASTPDTAKNFSAVAWYFAREIEAREHVPVGVIDSTWGGTVADAWTSLTALGADPGLAPVFTARGHMAEREPTALLREKYRQQLVDAAKAAGKAAPQFPWHPLFNMWGPAMLYNGMIAPLTAFPIRGVIWYQGESNSALERAPLYERLFRTLIEDWRNQWQIGDFPFLYVQIANFKSTPLEVWAPIREAQRRTLELRNTGMAVTIDVGNPTDVHPTDKVTVGHRLALTARAITYGETALEYSGPAFRQVTQENENLRVWFDHAEGLKAEGGTLTGFEVAGADGVFAAAEARIEGSTVVLTNPSVATPVAARYGWENNPECHLFNREGLPASPFSSEK
ncbi:sialate O-acetylesterase [Acidicapsa ligni]|uniref:sialate O-acetylesterase n=1 Tax=Acidicapsa ligni TaxID=542300 RepID=UPI0021E0DBE5|nr:sialate O-acetylesterase [Acidicapsa ligni]